LDILKLEYFQKVAHLGNMTQAASKLNISQPALSKSINQLEDSLSIKLFSRNGRKIELNQFGKVLLEYIDNAFLEIKEGEKVIKELAGLKMGNITVAATFPHFFPSLLVEYLKYYPDVRIKQVQASSIKMSQLIKNNEIDFGISTTPIIDQDIEWIPLLDEKIFLTVPDNHRLTSHRSVSLRELEKENFVGLVSGYGFRDITDSFCKRAGLKPNFVLELEDSGAIFKLVRMGYGIAFAPETSFLSNPPGVKPISIEFPDCKRTIGISFKTNHYLSEAANNFRQYIINYFNDIQKV